MSRYTAYLSLLCVIVITILTGVARAEPSGTDAVWVRLKQTYFSHRSIQNGDGVIGLRAPYRAEDAAIVPITIKDLLPPDSKRRIEKIWLVIDNNPVPMSAVFNFTPLAGSADIATRVRVNAYTHMRAIAETDDGKLYMATRYVKASGGCSAPASKDPQAALAHLGEMKLKAYDQTAPLGNPRQVLLMIRHPNNTGLQMNQLTRLYTPAHYVKQISVDYAANPVLTVNSTFSFSENPSLRFDFAPQGPGKLTAKVIDNKNMHFSESAWIEPMAVQAARP
jgi:sulfur-oxidizing protein SoxY